MQESYARWQAKRNAHPASNPFQLRWNGDHVEQGAPCRGEILISRAISRRLAVGEGADSGRMSDATQVRLEVQRGGRRRPLGGPWATAVLGQSWSAPDEVFTHRGFSNGGGNSAVMPPRSLHRTPDPSRERRAIPAAIGRDRDLGRYGAASEHHLRVVPLPLHDAGRSQCLLGNNRGVASPPRGQDDQRDNGTVQSVRRS